MPVYNSEKYLTEALNSVINQSFDDFELICVDDGSSDDSLKILHDFERKDSRIRIIAQENSGAGAARNNGLKVSKGEYIYFMDADDCIHLNLLKLTYENMLSNDSDIVLFKISNIQDGKETFVTPALPYEKIFSGVDFNHFTFNYLDVKRYALKLYYAPWTKLYRAEFLNKYDDFFFDEKLPYEDILFHSKAFLRASKISFVPRYLYHYRIDNDESVTFKYEDHIKIFNVIEDIESFLIREDYLDDLKIEFEYFKLSQIMAHMVLPIDEEYFKLAKSNLSNIDLSIFEKPPKWIKTRCAVFAESDSAEEYERNIKVPLLIEEHNKLKKVNKKLKNELKTQKNFNKKLLNSNSWKKTKFFRNVFKKF